MFKYICVTLLALIVTGCSPVASVTVSEHVDRKGNAVDSEVFRVTDGGDFFGHAQFRDKETGELLAFIDYGGRTVTGQIFDVGKQFTYAIVDITRGKIIAESSEGARYNFDVSPIVTGPTNMNVIDNRMNLSGRNTPMIVMLVPEELQGKLMALLNGA